MAEAVLMFAIRLPDGKWWRRGAGARGGAPISSFKKCTKYLEKGGAMGAAVRLDLASKYGGYAVVDVPILIGKVVFMVAAP